MEKTLHSPESQILSDYMKELRLRVGYTNQKKFAKKLKISNGSISRIELGERRIDIVEFYKICKMLKLDPEKEAIKLIREFNKSSK